MPKTKVVMIEQRVRRQYIVPADLGESAAAVQEYLNRAGWPDLSEDDKVWRTPRE
jgi:hypothetical protein